ncbi:MAG: alpha/beta hydrolase [Actinobacteria bacterium]|nr:MAG: alpha/beta hydrolase [Actinomycetota bacterium]
MQDHIVKSEGARLSAHEDGQGPTVLLLHGLTATRRYVVMGSNVLRRAGRRVVAYDARGHGQSSPADCPGAYTYADLRGDLRAVLDGLGVSRALLVGASMGAHTALALALTDPGRVQGLALVTPAYDPERHGRPADLARWDRLAAGLRQGGVEGLIAAYGDPGVAPAWRETVLTAIRKRLAAHEHPDAVADALSVVPRSRRFAAWADLAALALPTLVVGSRDEADPGHPLGTAERYAAELGAPLHVEPEGDSPLAWQGARLSRLVLELTSALP